MYANQDRYDIRFEWGEAGLSACQADSAAVIIVDVPSFATYIDAALTQSAQVYPFDEADERALAFAEARGGILASRDRQVGYSLSPASLRALPRGARLELASPNGSRLSLATGGVPTFALRPGGPARLRHRHPTSGGHTVAGGQRCGRPFQKSSGSTSRNCAGLHLGPRAHWARIYRRPGVAAALNVSKIAPVLTGGAYVAWHAG